MGFLLARGLVCVYVYVYVYITYMYYIHIMGIYVLSLMYELYSSRAKIKKLLYA